jgi:hypothetical protein
MVKPEFVQKRIFAKNGWEADIRASCKANGVILQGFSLLTANLLTGALLLHRHSLPCSLLPPLGTW